MILLLLAACGLPPAPPAPISGSGGGDHTATDDTSAACGDCALTDCADSTEPDAASEAECEAAADDQDCAEWEWTPC